MFIDGLYGNIQIDVPWELIRCPELQRLRDIRLCNINSPYITGGNSLNRFEHAIGTAYLAQILSKNLILEYSKRERRALIFASILHDVVTAPFGHSLEYLFEAIKNIEYEHANIWKMFFSGKTIPASRPIYYGKKSIFQNIIDDDTIELIIEILQLKHPLSKYLDNDIDIDNIDNVFRFAYHIGIKLNKNTPINLVKNLLYEDDNLIFSSDSLSLFKEWFDVRESLYVHLLENKGEFVSKAILERCFIDCIREGVLSENDWILTDTEIMEYMFKRGSKRVKNLVQKLMTMDFPPCCMVFSTAEFKRVDEYLNVSKIDIIDLAFEQGVYLHFIRDVNKTRRVLHGFGMSGDKTNSVTIGRPIDRYLIGLFSDDMKSIKFVSRYIEDTIGVELNQIDGGESDKKQISLFQD